MRVLVAMILSVLMYICLFSVILKTPYTAGLTHEYFKRKIAYASEIKTRKIVLYGGSNGLFSHRCETIESVAGIPCVNASLHAGLAIKVALNGLKEFLHTGDIVLLPLEYDQYTQTRDWMLHSTETGNYLVAYNHQWLHFLSYKGMAYALFSFDTKYFWSAIGENILSIAGVERRLNINTINRNGDVKGHSRIKGEEYQGYLAGLKQAEPSGDFVKNTYEGETEIRNFLRWASEKNIRVIGMLPTVFDDRPINSMAVKKIRNLYEAENQKFFQIEGNSQYSRACFYDTHYHLNEECQIEHSRKIAQELDSLLKK